MKTTKKQFLVGVMLITLVFSVWSGGQKEATKAEMAQVTLKFWKAGPNPLWIEYMEEAIERFHEDNPNISIEFSFYAWADMTTKLNVAFAGGTAPDVIHNSLGSIALFVEKGLYQNLGDYLSDYKELSDIIDPALEIGRYKGNVHAIGIYPVPALWAYRKDYFREAGLDPGNPPSIWEDWADASEKCTIREGDIVKRAGMVIPIDGMKIYAPMAWQNGAVTFKNELPTLNENEWSEALEFLTNLYQKRVSFETTMSQEESQNSFGIGRGAMAILQPAEFSFMLKNDPSVEDDVEFFSIKKKIEQIWAGAEFLMLSNASKYKDESWKFIQHMISIDECWARYQKTNCPVIRESLKEKYFNDNLKLNSAVWRGISNGQGNPLIPWARTWKKYTQIAIEEALTEQKTPKIALMDNYQLLLKDIQASK